MSKNKNSLQAVLERQAHTPPPAEAAPQSAPAEDAQPQKYYRPSRDGKRLVACHVTPAISKQLRLLAVEEDTSIQALMEEALDLLFVKKGRGKVIRVDSNT